MAYSNKHNFDNLLEVKILKKNQSTQTYGLYFKAILATCITILMFYPMFGGALTILNGSFVYFSYFLCVFLLLIYIAFDVMQQLQFKKLTENKITDAAVQQELKDNKLKDYLLFSYTTLIVMIGLLQGRYIMSPVLGLLYIFVELFQIYRMIANPKYTKVAEKTTYFDILKKVLFFSTSIVLLLGNQPFEAWNLPVATALLLLFNIINLLNIVRKNDLVNK